MRQIKFRFWHKSLGKIIYNPPLENRDNGVIVSIYDDEGRMVSAPLMQSIEIVDSNGADIYEGDIIEDHVGVGVVELHEGLAAYRVNYHNGRAKWFIDYNLRGERESIRVIGNVYENPDIKLGEK
jgi:hypothetical protein